MKLNLITKEDWSNASLGVKIFNGLLLVVSVVGGLLGILEFLDWIGWVS